MIRIRTPPLCEIISTDTNSVASAVDSLTEFYSPGGRFNYIVATRCIKTAYRGLHSINQLKAACGNPDKVGAKQNLDVIELAAPLAFGRTTQVFDLSPRKFSFTPNRSASYRIPFFFVEKGKIKLYYLLPRLGPYLGIDDISGYATVVKQFLLDQEFFGEDYDIEIVDVSRNSMEGSRTIKKFGLNDLELWSGDRLNDHLSVISRALDQIEREELVDPKWRARPLKDSDLPLFD